MNKTDTRLHKSPEQVSLITVTVLYFARLREALGRDSEQVSLPAGGQTVASLRVCLRSRGGAWDVELAPEKPVRTAVNQDMAQAETPLTEGDEVAFFPPVTGG
jgi:sulfur-carrier protein